MKKKKYALLALATMVAGANAECPTTAVSYGAGISVVLDAKTNKCVATIDADGTDHNTALSASINGVQVDTVHYFRAKSTNSKGQTVVFPFNVPKTCSISGASFYDFDGNKNKIYKNVESSGAKWTALIQKSIDHSETDLSAGKPYIIKFADNNYTIDIGGADCSLTFESTAPSSYAFDAPGLSGKWHFVGAYERKEWQEGDADLGFVYGLAGKKVDGVDIGNFVKAGAGASIPPLRAYLKFVPAQANKPAALTKSAAVASTEDPTSESTLPQNIEFVFMDANIEEVQFPVGECFKDSITDGELTPGYKSVEFKTVNGKRTACIDGHSRARLQTVSIPQDVVVDTVIYNRQFPAGNYASTIMLPFSTYDGCTPATNFFTAVRLTNYGQGLVVDFGAINNDRISAKVEANTPYLVITDNETMTFKTACWTGSETAKNVVLNTTVGESVVHFDNWEFRGSYQHIQWNEGSSALGRVYGFASKAKDGVSVGQFVKGAAGASVPPMRAYLYYNKVAVAAKAAAGVEVSSLSDEELPETITIRLLNKDGTVMSIGQMNTISGEITMDKDLWFDLKGRKFNKKPTVKGTYYNQGRKVIIK